MINAILVDDERKSLELLQDMLREFCPSIQVIATAKSVGEAQKVLETHEPDLVFLDIAMPDGYGFDLLDWIGERNFDVIFITAYNEFAVRAFEFSALHYLLKPINYEDLIEAVNRYTELRSLDQKAEQNEILRSGLQNNFNKLVVPGQNSLDFLNIEDILYFKASGSYTEIYLRNGSDLLASKTLSKFEHMLEDKPFHRVHDKYLVNLECIKSYVRGRGGHLILEDDTHITVSVRKRDEFLKVLAIS